MRLGGIHSDTIAHSQRPELIHLHFVRVLPLATQLHIQLNFSDTDTNGPVKSVLFSEVSTYFRVKMHARVVIGV